jgi:hypothetical protein
MTTTMDSQLRSVADRTLRFCFGTWYWGDAIAIDGLLEAHVCTGGPYRDEVIACLEHWSRFSPASFDDALVPARAVLALVAEGSLPRAAADRVVAALDRLPLFDRLIPALEPHRPPFRFGVCIDALYHLPAAVLLAGRYRGDPGAEKRAVALASGILEVLHCPTGWAQWYDFSVGRNNAVSWSRGLGWALLGLLDLLDLVESPAGNLVEAAGAIFEALASAQAESGHWAAVLGDTQAAEETSTAAFFVAGALHPRARALGVNARTLEAATAAVLSAVTPDGTYEGVSSDVLPVWDLASYERFSVEPSPWGQGAALRALAALAANANSSDDR